MAIPNNASEIVGVIASLGMLTPLIKALHKWHIDIRKTAKSSQDGVPAPTQTLQTGSKWSRMSRFDRFTFVYGMLGHMACFICLLVLIILPVHAATSREVAVVGILVLSAISAGRFIEQ
jgi:hypothetical protein